MYVRKVGDEHQDYPKVKFNVDKKTGALMTHTVNDAKENEIFREWFGSPADCGIETHPAKVERSLEEIAKG